MTPRLALLTTGGTIAAVADRPEATTGYRLTEAGALLPTGLDRIATILPEAFAAVQSPDVDLSFMLRLARRLSELLGRDDVDGAIVTHGTDTLEETAWFLHLTVCSAKPIVLTGAMRPGSALGADGPMNLFAAAVTAADPEARGRGVLVVLNDRIHGARLVRKAHTTAPDAFRGGELGVIAAGQPIFTAAATGRHTTTSAFDATLIVGLPPVEIVLAYAGASAMAIEAVQRSGAAGLVIACTGNGSLSAPFRDAVVAAMTTGLIVVRASRTLDGVVCWPGLPGMAAGLHTPQKARLLLSLALTQSSDPEAIQAVFDAS